MQQHIHSGTIESAHVRKVKHELGTILLKQRLYVFQEGAILFKCQALRNALDNDRSDVFHIPSFVLFWMSISPRLQHFKFYRLAAILSLSNIDQLRIHLS